MLTMELTDLAKTLSKDRELEVEIRVHSYTNTKEKKLYVSHFWNHREPEAVISGMKTDVFLRAFGNVVFTDPAAVTAYINRLANYAIPSFAAQMFVLLEDLRIEEHCKQARPGMSKEFTVRRQIYSKHFTDQLKVNLDKSLYTDALYCLTYLMLNSNSPLLEFPHFNQKIDSIVPIFHEKLFEYYSARNTGDIADLCENLLQLVSSVCANDMLNEYFHLSKESAMSTTGLEYRDLLRKDPLANQDKLDEKSSQDEEIVDEEMKTWHRETKDHGKSFMQFDLQQGTQTDMLTNDAREGEAGDQAMAIVQGSARKSANKDFSALESLDEKRDEKGKDHTPFGKENKQAKAIFQTGLKASDQERKQYESIKASIQLYQTKLKTLINRTLERKKTEPRKHLPFGRLDQKLVHFFTEEQPKLFYKKSDPSRQIDAVFMLLVDCSASMQDKMEETKRGIVLFHEALKAVKVAHEIAGFWEDAAEANAQSQPNYFKLPVTFANSLQLSSGPEIMKLEGEEDNRDGFAIRVMSERLVRRYESQKFLLVFSDGEPAAFGYSQNGIVDTHEAVTEARRKGIEVFNIFLSHSPVGEEQRKVFQNIYGAYSIIVPSVDQLPDVLFPLLKRLLSKSIV